MPYLRVNGDGSTTVMGQIVGYRVIYKDRTGAKKKSKPFDYFWQANVFKQHLTMGSDPVIIPQYQSDAAALAK